MFWNQSQEKAFLEDEAKSIGLLFKSLLKLLKQKENQAQMEKDFNNQPGSVRSHQNSQKCYGADFISQESHYEKDLDIDGALCTFILLFD